MKQSVAPSKSSGPGLRATWRKLGRSRSSRKSSPSSGAKAVTRAPQRTRNSARRAATTPPPTTTAVRSRISRNIGRFRIAACLTSSRAASPIDLTARRAWPNRGAPSLARVDMPSSALFTLGTRGSPLALVQANETRRRLSEAHGWDVERIALKVIRTSGDAIQDRPLAEAGGKGLFTKEIDVASAGGRDRRRRPLGQGPAEPHGERRRNRRLPAARGCARRADLFLRRHDRRPARGREPRRGVAQASGAGAQAEAGSQARAPARQCRDAAQEGRGRRGRRDASGDGGPEAPRPRPPRPRAPSTSRPSCRRPGRARSR